MQAKRKVKRSSRLRDTDILRAVTREGTPEVLVEAAKQLSRNKTGFSGWFRDFPDRPGTSYSAAELASLATARRFQGFGKKQPKPPE